MPYVKKYTRLCEVRECLKKHHGVGLCLMHYQRYKKYGSPHKVKNIYRDDKARLLSKVNKVETGCWEWIATINEDGYGQLGMRWRGGYSNRSAHRVSYEIFKGDTEDGMHVDHLCFNKKCVNPEHLELVTVSVNNQRRCDRIKELRGRNGIRS